VKQGLICEIVVDIEESRTCMVMIGGKMESTTENEDCMDGAVIGTIAESCEYLVV
jgi:hypothetical protein